MTSRSTRLTLALFAIIAVAFPRYAGAQNWSFDARAIALGGTGSTGNLADNMIDKQRPYSSIVLPFGLFQVLGDLDVYNPDSPKFDPIRAIEYASSPIHYIVNRATDNSAQALFVSDIRNATFSRDLSRYKGFVPSNNILAEGLASPSWGGTIKFHRDDSGGYQGVFIGAGPYLSLHDAATFDQQLINVLSTGVNVANAVMPITNGDQVQAAVAITGGYRGRFAWPGASSGSAREGIYVAANFNYLRGFMYENDGLTVTLATDRAGLLAPTSTVTILHQDADSGTGFAIDVGAGVVYDRWAFGFGANGIANRIDWTGVKQSAFRLASLTSGNGNFIESVEVAAPDVRVELPVDYRGNVTYDAGNWSATVQAGHGFGGGSFHGGYEHRFGRLEARGGARYTFGMWNPTAGIGVDLSRRRSFDVAFFGTSTNIERKRQLAIATSFRINHL
jgi:hypothetical protein